MFTLKVAHKVIIGFGFIALLLLLSSGSALVSFSAVTRSSELVNQLAVPVQQQSNMAQIQLLKLAKLSALGYTADNASAIKNNASAIILSMSPSSTLRTPSDMYLNYSNFNYRFLN